MIRPRLILIVLSLLLVPGAHAAEQDFTITLASDGSAAYDGPAGLASPGNEVPGSRYTWDLDLSSNYTVAEVRIMGAFDVDRPKQVVPLLDGKHFIQITAFDVAEVDEPARVLKLNELKDGFAYRLGIPGPGKAVLSLAVDRTAPTFHLEDPSAVTHYSFYMETRTDESAYGTLKVRPAADMDAEWVEFPTPTPDKLHRYPVQGLQPATRYNWFVAFEDWSGNVASTDTFTLTTRPKPAVPLPIVKLVTPEDGSRITPEDRIIEASIESPGSDIVEGGVRLFVDLKEVHEGFTVTDGILRYTVPADFDIGVHRVSVEVTNELEGKTVAQSKFTVDRLGVPGPGILGILGMVSMAAIAAGLRRR